MVKYVVFYAVVLAMFAMAVFKSPLWIIPLLVIGLNGAYFVFFASSREKVKDG